MDRQRAALFVNQLSALHQGGLSLINACLWLAEYQRDWDLRDLADRVVESLRKGSSLSEALARHQQAFGGATVRLVRAAETRGDVAVALSGAARLMSGQVLTRQRIVSALLYPVVLWLAFTVLWIVLSFYVVPQLDALGQNTQNVSVPPVILSLEWLLVLGVPLLVLLFSLAPNTAFKSWIRLKLPFFGGVELRRQLGDWLFTVAGLLAAGSSLEEAAAVANEGLDNVLVKSRFDGWLASAKRTGRLDLNDIAESLSSLQSVPLWPTFPEEGDESVVAAAAADGGEQLQEQIRFLLDRFAVFAAPVAVIVLSGLLFGLFASFYETLWTTTEPIGGSW